jgi:hypothetical protein
MTLGVWLPFSHCYRCPGSTHALLRGWWCDRQPKWSDRASTTTSTQCSWQSDRGLRWLDCPWNRGWRSDHHSRWSNRPALHGPFIACFANFGRASRCAHDFGGGPRDTPDSNSDSGCASYGSSVPALLISPSGCVGAIGTAPTSAVAAGEGRTGGTSDQPSSNDHAGEAGLLAPGR